MNVAFVAVGIQAQVMRNHDDLGRTYERLPDAHQFWGMVDLVDSSNFRLGKLCTSSPACAIFVSRV